MKITRKANNIKAGDVIETLSEEIVKDEITNPTDVEDMTEMVLDGCEYMHEAHLCIMEAIDKLANCPDNEIAREAIANLSVVAFSLE